MPWFKVDDKFHAHPKVIAAGNEAVGLYIRCGTYAADHLTDGFIAEHVALLYGTAELAETLVRTRLWRRVRGGWQMPDYLDYNPSKEAVEKDRKNAAERQRRRREGLASRRDSRVTSTVSTGPPTRPDPYSSTGSYQRAGPGYPQAGKPDFAAVNGSAASRQPPPFAEAQQRALHPDPRPTGRHARPAPQPGEHA